jgi:hypothetical protein
MTGFDSKRQMAQDKEALKLALIIEEFDGNDESLPLELLKPIAETLRTLAQPAQEPVAWGFRHDDGAIYDCISPEAHADCEGEYNVPLYAAPPEAQPEQEPMAWAVYDKRGGSKSLHWPENHSPNGDATKFDAVPLYTTPPQRPWVGLTKEEIDSYFEDHGWSPSEHYYPVIKDIEAALRSKNT